ncbi:10087_t:CDS:2 [Scutellospora calospora]|uniref:10087_t:CDS:1 n=1 Tax=Scutellospora calospora TaxID=85575 RepID=A0ACA9K3N4_9GLOM|nr:10087_t:CDS:2 [Scutellospora calospora]
MKRTRFLKCFYRKKNSQQRSRHVSSVKYSIVGVDDDFEMISLTESFKSCRIDENSQNREKLSIRKLGIRSLALFISFRKDENYNLEFDTKEFHFFGFHPVHHNFSKYKNQSELLHTAEFVQNCALNCWANGWRIIVIMHSHLRCCKFICELINQIRKFCDNQTLDIVITQPKNKNEKLEARENNEYIRQFNANLGPTALIGLPSDGLFNIFCTHEIYKDDENGIQFYDKKEPYYEFTNFFETPIQIDSKKWKNSEIVQAQKFREESLQNKIRFASNAREAFMIARKNDNLKRKDWELSKQPTGKIFKENVMKKAIHEKFSQNKNLRYKLLSTSNAPLFEHTDNDYYWGDGGKQGGGRNRLGEILQEVRESLMLDEIRKLEEHYNRRGKRWIIEDLEVLIQRKLRSLNINQALRNTEKLFVALDQKPFLKCLKFNSVDFSTISPEDIKMLSQCRNLILLEFVNCKGITLDHCTTLLIDPLIKLKELKLLSKYFDPLVVNSLITMWGSNLETLYMNQVKTLELSNTLINYCSNLEYFHVYITDGDGDVDEFLLQFLSQSSLQHFTMTTYYSDNFSYKLGQNLPITLKCLELKKCSLTSEGFDKFLKNCSHLVKLEKLTIGNNQPKLDHYISLREFIKSCKSLKEITFYYLSFFIEVSIEEKIKEIIKEISNYGVVCRYYGYENKSDDY